MDVVPGSRNVVKIKYRERGPTGRLDDPLIRHQLQLLLRGIHSVLANCHVTPADAFRGRTLPGEGVPCMGKRC
ncbi:hypothetical protein [Streptomyces klenkii]|uniref:hypothetical protein n=1 Tax=Streptomyces klenkii TaxID=1420899 RepID=UPI0011C48638|nr:hypothetical protein [Streptomyces klenkii]